MKVEVRYWPNKLRPRQAQSIEYAICNRNYDKPAMADNGKIIECSMEKTEKGTNDSSNNDNDGDDDEQYQHLQYLCMHNDWIC